MLNNPWHTVERKNSKKKEIKYLYKLDFVSLYFVFVHSSSFFVSKSFFFT